MPVTKDDVRKAYHLLLDREPESEAVLESLMELADIQSLRNHFMASTDFLRANTSVGHRVEEYFADAAQIAEIEASSHERQLMFERIAAAWAAYGETEPHWSVLVCDAFCQHNLAHNIEEFYISGRREIATLLAFAERAGAKLPVSAHALDFGCGVGRLTLSLAERFGSVVGVDISPGHLRIARKRASETGISNVRFEQIRAVNDLALWNGEIDFVLSRIVLQHNPPPIIAALLEGLLHTLKRGGIAIIQVPTYIPGQDFRIAEYLATPQPQMEVNALPQRHIFEIIDRVGCVVLEVREDNSMGSYPGVSQTFAIRRK